MYGRNGTIRWLLAAVAVFAAMVWPALGAAACNITGPGACPPNVPVWAFFSEDTCEGEVLRYERFTNDALNVCKVNGGTVSRQTLVDPEWSWVISTTWSGDKTCPDDIYENTTISRKYRRPYLCEVANAAHDARMLLLSVTDTIVPGITPLVRSDLPSLSTVSLNHFCPTPTDCTMDGEDPIYSYRWRTSVGCASAPFHAAAHYNLVMGQCYRYATPPGQFVTYHCLGDGITKYLYVGDGCEHLVRVEYAVDQCETSESESTCNSTSVPISLQPVDFPPPPPTEAEPTEPPISTPTAIPEAPTPVAVPVSETVPQAPIAEPTSHAERKSPLNVLFALAFFALIQLLSSL